MSTPLLPLPDLPGFRDLTADVVELLEGRGTVTKDQIDALYAPTPDEYAELCRRLDQKRGVRRRPGRAGGFELVEGRPLDTASADDHHVTLTADELSAVDRVEVLLKGRDLSELVGDELRGVLRSVRRIQTGVDRPLRNRELAIALVIKHGDDLLADADVRKAIGRGVNAALKADGRPTIEVPNRWHPGKRKALAFVEAAGFPPNFAGTPAAERPVDFEFLQGRVELRGLEPFQTEVKSRMIEVLSSRNGRAVITLPTGAGKTRTAVEGLREWLASRHTNEACALQNVVLWLAHTEELCEQAYASFRQVWENSHQACPLYLFRFWGPYTADLVRHRETLSQAMREASVFISTPQRFANLIREATDEAKDAVGRLRNSVGAVVIDEAHRAAAPSYQQILSLFEGVGNAAVVGLTATPFRTEYAEDGMAGTYHLARLFLSQIVEPVSTLGADPRTRLQDMGVLARPVLETLETHVRLTLPSRLRGGHLAQEDMERADIALRLKADASAARRLRLAERIAEICVDSGDHSILYFGPSVADAASVAFLLRERGHRAAFVSGNTPEAVRRRLIQEFRDGQVRVLCNCEVLTTGFDAPMVTHVVVGRPTVSQVLYEQMVGRGLRGPKFGGTDHCVIVNCKDDYREGSPTLGWVEWRNAWKPEETSSSTSTLV